MNRDIDLTRLDRLKLANQYKILAKLYPDEADEYERYIEIVERGYAFEYGDLFYPIEAEIGDELCREVLGVLNLHRALSQGFSQAGEQSLVKKEEIEFRGYDGNNESDQMAFAQYFIAKKGRFEELYISDDFNTHCPMTNRYRAMFEAWREIPAERAFDLTIQEIRDILDVRLAP